MVCTQQRRVQRLRQHKSEHIGHSYGMVALGEGGMEGEIEHMTGGGSSYLKTTKTTEGLNLNSING